MLKRLEDVSSADWLADGDVDWTRLVSLGPVGYPTFARLRYIPDPIAPKMAEPDAELPDDHPAELAQARRVLTVLADFTDTADRCYFCVWEGWGGSALDVQVGRPPLVELPHRRYALFAGPLAEIDGWAQLFTGGEPGPPPAFVWPADRRWCFSSDVDPHWAGIGADRAAIDALLGLPDVDVVEAGWDETPPAYRG